MKKVRKNHSSEIGLLTSPEGPDASDLDEGSESSAAAEEASSQSTDCTPLTPLSSKPSPRFPSRLKTIHCPYPDCQKTFNRPANLAEHLRSHSNTRLFKCPHTPCPKDFLRETHLKHHIKSQHSDVRDHLCDWPGCGKRFVTGTRLRRHHAAHEGQEPFRCQVEDCGQVFRKHGTLQKHITVVHEGKSPFICRVVNRQGEECGAGFDGAGKLKSHEGRVHGTKRFWCAMCSSATRATEIGIGQQDASDGFSTYAELQAHIGIEHAPTCEACGLQCKSQRALKSHIDIVHGLLDVDARRKHVCVEPGCGRAFTKRGNLNVHVRTIHGQKKFVCGGADRSTLNNIADWDGSGACGRVLSTKQSLEVHIRTFHVGHPSSQRNADMSLINCKKNRKKPISALVRLTGAGYEDESGRDITCLMPHCKYRFMRDYDLEVHLSIHRGLSTSEIERRCTEGENLVSRFTWDGSLVLASGEDAETEHALDQPFGMEEIQSTFQRGQAGGPDSGTDTSNEVNGADFQRQQNQDVEIIDPSLR